MIRYQSARQIIVDQVGKNIAKRGVESVALAEASARVLAADILADRDYPPFDRTTRDGYAVRAAEVFDGAVLQCVGEIKAGDVPAHVVSTGQCLQIMTGACVSGGADAVVMVEHASREGDAVRFSRNAVAEQNIVRRGSEARAGQAVLTAGMRIGYAELAQAAQVGAAELSCFRRARVAILSTGDEIVPFAASPGEFQIRNSNTVSLAAQVRMTGGVPIVLDSAADIAEDLRAKISEGLREDILILSGGVSAGKYDLVENVLRELGAEILFDAVAIRPGKPAVFAMCKGKPVFGLPGNPVSTMVTFELFVSPAIDMLNGAKPRALAFVEAELAEELHEKPGMTHFLPARLEWVDSATHGAGGEAKLTNALAAKTLGGKVHALRWQGSG
ncbi:MAG TPA: gephyrin-like molybdotransferase Glp, partial [Candidatus Dormibacteraeota bacterium]|nr:gephyrin-like molybdotransferase Glp [Candidatus Dormibacteraeota bacterium]